MGALIVVVQFPTGSADADRSHTWSWIEEGDAGDVGLRLTIDFGEANDCRFLLVTSRVAEDGDLASFYGRDDESIVFHVEGYTRNGWVGAWNHGGEAESHGYKIGDQAFLVQTLVDIHEGIETWIFAGYQTALVDPGAYPPYLDVPTDPYRLEISCTKPFTLAILEKASTLHTFGPADTCVLARKVGAGVCGMSAGVAEEGTLDLDGDRNVVRYHQFSFTQDVGTVRLEGPNTQAEMTYMSNGFMRAPPGIRIEDTAGVFEVAFSHLGAAPYTVGGYAFPFQAVDDAVLSGIQ